MVTEQEQELLDGLDAIHDHIIADQVAAKKLVAALEKIADPRKRDHSEPDAYTQLGCVMNIANEALKEWNK